MFNKLKNKVTAQKFIFTFHIHVLQPWPPGTKLLAVGWQRGKSRRGSTRAVTPTMMPGRLAGLVKLNESFELPATLYKAPNAGAHSPLGPFKKKCVILAILETDSNSQSVTPVGRIVIDLADYAALDGQELKTFAVACNKSISAAVGEPQLTVTVRCRWKKAAGPGAPGDAVSMSTDTTGSNLTFGAFPNFLRLGGGTPKTPVESDREQDLKGFKLAELPSIPEADGHHEPEDMPRTPSTTSSRDSTPERERLPPATPPSLSQTPTSQPSIPASNRSFNQNPSPGAANQPFHPPPAPAPPSPRKDLNGILHDSDLDEEPEPLEAAPKVSRRAIREENKSVGKSRVSTWLQQHDEPLPTSPPVSAPTNRGGPMPGRTDSAPPTASTAYTHSSQPPPQPAATPPAPSATSAAPAAAPAAHAVPAAPSPFYAEIDSAPPASASAGPSSHPPAANSSGSLSDSISRKPSSDAPPGARPTTFAELHSSLDALASNSFSRRTRTSTLGSEISGASSTSTVPSTAIPPPPVSTSAVPRAASSDATRTAALVGLPASKSVRSRWSGRPADGDAPAAPTASVPPVVPRQRVTTDSVPSPPQPSSPSRPAWGVRQVAPRAATGEQPPLVRTTSRNSGGGSAPSSPQPRRSSAMAPDTPASSGPQSPLTSVRAASSRNGRSEATTSKSAAIKAELCTAAALEAAVYLPRIFATRAKQSGRALHAPARRIARTIVCLGLEQGTAFGQSALKLVGQLTQGSGEDVEGMAFWWSNVCHLRGFLQALDLAASSGRDLAARHWAAAAFVEPLNVLESGLFFQALDFLWHRVLVPQISAGRPESSRSSSPTTRDAAAAIAAARKAGSEAAVRRWMIALDAVAARIPQYGRPSHVGRMRQQLLLQCLRRVDALLLANLLSAADGGATTPKYHELTRLLGDSAAADFDAPVVDEAALPFGRGGLNFGVGMNIKIAVTRLQQWAFEVVTEAGDNPAALEGVALFPLLRAAADLLMMPKDLLLDDTIRQDVCAALSIKSILHIVEAFQPDEYTPDVIAPEVIQTLRQEASTRAGQADKPPGAAYSPPTDEDIMESVEAGQEPGLEYDDESEDELTDMSRLMAVGSESGKRTKPYRYRLLHELWNVGVPRRKMITLG